MPPSSGERLRRRPCTRSELATSKPGGNRGATRDAVASLEPPSISAEGLEGGWTRLDAWAEAKAIEFTEARIATAAAEASAKTEQEAVATALVELCGPFGVRTTIERTSAGLAAAEASASAEAATYRTQLEERAELVDQVAALAEEQAVAHQLGQLLSANGFERWLLAVALEDLGDRASERLEELSGGQYSLEGDENAFVVRDHRNADERRDVKTLSGGETFLTSLALALALADGIRELASGSTPRLDSVFLDEGFGTLDPDTLDVVSTAIEELGSAGRMVGIVTHIRELAERMPTRFEVSKGMRSSAVARVEV